MRNLFVINFGHKILNMFKKESNNVHTVEDGEKPNEGHALHIGNECIHVLQKMWYGLQFKMLHCKWCFNCNFSCFNSRACRGPSYTR